MMKIAAQLGTVRAFCNTQNELFETLSRLKRMGFDGVETESGLLKNAEGHALAEKISELGLTVCSIRSPFARTDYDMDGMIAQAKALNCRNVGVGTITASYFFSGAAATEKYLDQARGVCERFRSEGLVPLYSLRDHEFMRQSDGEWIFDKLAGRAQTADYQWETDVLSLTRAGVAPQTIFARLAGRMPVCRLSDQKIRENDVYFFYAKREECPLGEGLFDLPAWARAARRAGTEWFTVGQELCDRDPFACLEQSLAYARKLCGEK